MLQEAQLDQGLQHFQRGLQNLEDPEDKAY